MVSQGQPDPACLPQVQLVNDAYGLVVDAVMGPGVEPCEVGGPCTRALATLKLLSIPLVSLDIPSGMPGRRGHVRVWGTWSGEGGCALASGALACLPTLSLSFPSVDGSCTLGMAESHVHPSEEEDQGCCPGDPVSPCPPTPSPACPLPTLAQLPRQT